MIRGRDRDVPPPKILQDPLLLDGSSDTAVIYQACLCTLIDIVGEAKSKVRLFLLHTAWSVLKDKIILYSIYVCTLSYIAEVQILILNSNRGGVGYLLISIFAVQTLRSTGPTPNCLCKGAASPRSTSLALCCFTVPFLTHNLLRYNKYHKCLSQVSNLTWTAGNLPLLQLTCCAHNAVWQTTPTTGGTNNHISSNHSSHLRQL